jgi:hypothetical protein
MKGCDEIQGIEFGCVLGKIPGVKQSARLNRSREATRGCLARLGYRLAWKASPVGHLTRRIVIRPEEASVVIGQLALHHSFIVRETCLQVNKEFNTIL